MNNSLFKIIPNGGIISTPIRDDVEDECGLSVYDFNGHCVVQEPPNSQPLFSQ